MNFLRSASLFVFLFSAAQPVGAEVLNFKKTLQTALDHSPAVAAATQQVRIAELQEQNAAMVFYPTFAAQGQTGLTRSQPSLIGGQFPLASQASLTMTETLYDNGNNRTALKVAQKKRELAQLALQKTRDQVLRDVSVEFFNHALLAKRVDIQQSQVALVKKQYDVVSRAYQQGLKTGKDFLRFKTQVVRSEIDFEVSKSDLAVSKKQLQSLLANAHEDMGDDDFEVEVRPSPVQNVPTAAPPMSNHYETLLADGQKFLADMQTEIVLRPTRPELFLTSSAGYGSSQFLGTGATWDDNQTWNYNALITLRYTLWDFGIRQRNLQVALANREGVDRSVESILIKTKTDLEKLMIDLKLRAKNFKLSDQLLKLEQKNFATIESEYRLGRVQYLDLITGLRDLSSARAAYFSSLFALKQDVAIYRYNARDIYDWIFHE